MAIKLNRQTGGWHQLGAADVITEDQFGYDPSRLYFPGVSSCTAAIAQTLFGLCGIHLTMNDNDAEIGALVTRMGQYCQNRASRIYLVGVLHNTGNGCVQGSPFRGVQAMKATLIQRLSAGGIQCFGASTPAMQTDVRVTLAGGMLTAAVRPQSHPATTDTGWQGAQLSPI